VGDVPFYVINFLLPNQPAPFKNASFQLIFDHSALTITPRSKKSLIMTNMASSEPLDEQRGLQMQRAIFLIKLFLFKKICYKLTLCESFQWQSYKAFTCLSNSVRHSSSLHQCFKVNQHILK